MKDLLKDFDNNHLQVELRHLVRLLITALEEGKPLMKVEVKIEGLNADSLEVLKKLSDVETLLQEVLNRFTRSKGGASVVSSVQSPQQLSPEEVKEKQKEGLPSLEASHLVQIWRSCSQQEGASLEDAIKRNFPYVSIEPVNLSDRDRDDRWRLIAVYPGPQRTSETDALILPRKWENWFFELYNKWFDCDGTGRRKGIIVDIVKPASGRWISDAWEPVQKGHLIVKGPAEYNPLKP